MSIENRNYQKMKNLFFCADINKKKMRKIIITSNRRKQKKMLLNNLCISFNTEKKSEKGKMETKQNKTKIHVVNFLPQDLSEEKEALLKKKKENLNSKNLENVQHLENFQNSEYILTIYELKKQKMIKIIYDFFYNILLFCINKNLSLVEISTFLSINKYIFFKLINTCPNITTLFLEYKAIMLNHSISRLPYSVKVFSFSSFKLLIKYSLNTLFKHFPFYKYIFNPSHKIYFECIDINDSYEKKCIDNYCADDINITDDVTSLSLSCKDNVDYVQDLIKLKIGCVNNLNSDEEKKNSFIKEFKTYLEMFHIKNDSVVFEVNNFHKVHNIDQIIKQIKKEQVNTTVDLTQEDIQKNKTKITEHNKEQLVKKINLLYKDLENRIMCQLGQYIGNNIREEE